MAAQQLQVVEDVQVPPLASVLRFFSYIPMSTDVLAAYYAVGDSTTALPARVALAIMITYLVTPFDAVPDTIPVVGLADDAAVISTTLAAVAGSIRPQHYDRARNLLRRAGANPL